MGLKNNKVLVLLSSGKDSKAVVEKLLKQGYEVEGLCFDGFQHTELEGAKKTAKNAGIKLHFFSALWFDELTYDPIKLIFRNIFTAFYVLPFCIKNNIQIVALGAKKSDIIEKRLFWLPYLIFLIQNLIKIFRIKMIFPVWE